MEDPPKKKVRIFKKQIPKEWKDRKKKPGKKGQTKSMTKKQRRKWRKKKKKEAHEEQIRKTAVRKARKERKLQRIEERKNAPEKIWDEDELFEHLKNKYDQFYGGYKPAKRYLNLKNITFAENATDPVTGMYVNSLWVKKVMKPTKNKAYREKYDHKWQYYRDRKRTPFASIYKKYRGYTVKILYSGDPVIHVVTL